MITKKSYFSNRVLKILSNLQLAITLLFIIGIVVAIGKIIEQDQSLSFYKENYPIENPFFGFVDWQFINAFNLDKLYTTVWFFSLLFFFSSTIDGVKFITPLFVLFYILIQYICITFYLLVTYFYLQFF